MEQYKILLFAKRNAFKNAFQPFIFLRSYSSVIAAYSIFSPMLCFTHRYKEAILLHTNILITPTNCTNFFLQPI